MPILIIFMIAISLSMDAFSLSLAYGTLNLKEKDIHFLSVIVGIYHFVMPLLGVFVGTIILKHVPLSPNIIVFIVLSFIGFQMIVESFKEQEKIKRMTRLEMLLFGLAVSLDSFSLGIGLKTISSYYLLCSCIFAFTSFSFTFLGLYCGQKIHQKTGAISTRIGGIVLMILGISYLL